MNGAEMPECADNYGAPLVGAPSWCNLRYKSIHSNACDLGCKKTYIVMHVSSVQKKVILHVISDTKACII